MENQNLFKALQNVCGFTALESEMLEIIDAVDADRAAESVRDDDIKYLLTCDKCGCHPTVLYRTSKGRLCTGCKHVN